MSFKPQDILFVSPLDRHDGALTAVRDALGGGEVQCGTGFSEAVRQGFRTGRPVVGLCAAGILIRLVAPLLTDKHVEPPVLVMTEKKTNDVVFVMLVMMVFMFIYVRVKCTVVQLQRTTIKPLCL